LAWRPLAASLLLGACLGRGLAATNEPPSPSWLSQPMSMFDAVRLALLQNSDILKAGSDLEATHGVVMQTRAVALPKVQAEAGYLYDAAADEFGFDGNGISRVTDQWNAGIRIVQTLYEGGRLRASLRSARLTREQSLLAYQTVVADTLLAVRTAYYDVLLAEQEILVQEASVKLLAQELENASRRFEAGAVPRFDVLRGEVAVANAKPRLIRARNTFRVAKNNLATVLGYNIPAHIWEDIPMQLTGRLESDPVSVELPAALAQARARRPELAVLGKTEALAREGITLARAGGLPRLGVFAGYGGHNSRYVDSFFEAVAGATAGVQLQWDLWDGNLTRGKVKEARAQHRRVEQDLEDVTRRVEQEVRTAYSTFLEAREVLESQRKNQEQADEALRLATARYEAGTGTQLDVLDAQTALTQARTTQIQALHGYAVARARLERAVGQDVTQTQAMDRKP
jgi:TolC family type I secretion outer membrane protein